MPQGGSHVSSDTDLVGAAGVLGEGSPRLLSPRNPPSSLVFSHFGSPVHPLCFILSLSFCRAKLKNKKEVCLDPDAPLMKKIIQKILDRYLLPCPLGVLVFADWQGFCSPDTI